MPYADPEKQLAAMRGVRARHKAGQKAAGTWDKGDHTGQERRRRARRRHEMPFAGVDGEGGDVADTGALFGSSHEYLFMRAGDQTLKNTFGTPLEARQCLAFLADLPKGQVYVSYYFDYDVTMMLRRLPKEKITELLRPKGRNINVGVRWEGFEFRYMQHKEFAVGRTVAGGKTSFTVVSDVGPFFQQGFAKTIEDWQAGTADERALIAATKLNRSQFGELTQETEDYCALECLLLEDVMEQFREVCDDVDCLPDRWQGPGWLASKLLGRENVPKGSETGAFRNQRLWDAAIAAYYGGRFEAFLMGPVPGPVYEYDINSAYPYAMTKLPCLKCGSWSQRKTIPEGNALWFAEVEFSHTTGAAVCHLPVRTALGGLVFPRSGSGTYWSVEVSAARRSGTSVSLAGACFVYTPGRICQCEPFGFVPGLYEERKRLGGLRGKVLKLALNSLYGKLAQSIGRPPYANPVWASLITAHTRAMLIDAYRGHEDDLVMLATDAVYSRVPLELDCGPGLGAWEPTVHGRGLFVVQPGVYYSGDEHRSKTRGVEQKAFDGARDRFEEAFRLLTLGVGEPVVIRGTSFLGLRQALAWNRLEQAGQWLDTEKKVSIDVRSKRSARAVVDRAGFLRTWAQDGGEASVPYSRAIGGAFREAREESADQPDWGDWFTPV